MEIDIPFLQRLVVWPIYHTGSREICDPMPLDTDDDWILLAESNEFFFILHQLLYHSGWEKGGKKYNNNPEFWSWRKGDVNLLVTQNRDYYDKFVLATKVAKNFNVLKKEERIDLFNAILYNRGPLHEPDRDWSSFLPKNEFDIGLALR